MSDEYIPKKKRSAALISELEEFETPDDLILPSSILKQKQEEDRAKESMEAESFDSSWMDTLSTLHTEGKRGKKIGKLFESYGEDGKKKKKKKKDKDGPIDHYDDFEREISMLQNILSDQTKLSASLQNRYDTLERTKSSARGVGKFTTDLITTLNTSRSLCKDTVRELINVKSKIAELNMKEREKFAKNELLEGDDSSQYASQFLKKLLSVNSDFDGSGEAFVDDVENPDDYFDELITNMENNDNYEKRDSEADQYLKYENVGVSVKVLCDVDENCQFFAEDRDGNLISDYPLPNTVDTLSVNHSTKIATDKYGQKFQVVFQ